VKRGIEGKEDGKREFGEKKKLWARIDLEFLFLFFIHFLNTSSVVFVWPFFMYPFLYVLSLV
jgi:hypothetical protein